MPKKKFVLAKKVDSEGRPVESAPAVESTPPEVIDPQVNTVNPTLSDWRRKDLNASAISDKAMDRLSLRDAPDDNGWILPWSDGTDSIELLVYDRDKRPPGGRKNDWPKGQTAILNRLREGDAELVVVVEGVRQSLAVASWDLKDGDDRAVAIYAMNGCDGIHAGIADRLPALFEDKRVVVIFDADLLTNERVGMAAGQRVPKLLHQAGAKSVKVTGSGGVGKDGLDDVLARTREEEQGNYLMELINGAIEIKPAGDPVDLFMSGEDFLALADANNEPLWGNREVCLWMPGESFMPVGPPGVGKTTLEHLLVWGWFGLIPEVLGWEVRPGGGKVLYLAMDRPQQIARAMARLREPEHAPTIREELVVRAGPLPVDICEERDWIRDQALEVGAKAVVIDSLKDVLPDPSDEKRAGQYNQARQSTLAAGIEWSELHHNRKAGAGNKEPNTLEDVYGSRWLTAGAGSVLSLFGEPGDTVVSLKQLKTPAGELYPKRVVIDKLTGRMELFEDVDVPGLLARAGRSGYTVRGLAMALHPGKSPNQSQVESMRIRLKRMAKEVVPVPVEVEVAVPA
jgi:AAA domain